MIPANTTYYSLKSKYQTSRDDHDTAPAQRNRRRPHVEGFPQLPEDIYVIQREGFDHV